MFLQAPGYWHFTSRCLNVTKLPYAVEGFSQIEVLTCIER